MESFIHTFWGMAELLLLIVFVRLIIWLLFDKK